MYKRAHWYFSIALLVAAAGFFPLYLSRLGDASFQVHVHASVSTAWIVLLITQAWLISRRKIFPHRILGRFSIVLYPVLVGTGSWILSSTVIEALDRGLLTFSRLYIMDWILMPFAAAMYILALVNRRNVHVHQRCMALTLLPLFPPAMGRAVFFYALYPMGHGFDAMWHPMAIIMLLIIAAAIFFDHRSGRVHWPYPAAFVAMLFAYAIGTFAATSAPVLGFLRWTAS